jgi:hypothetical protein
MVSRALQIGVSGDEVGRWRTKTELVFDRSTHQLVRKAFTIWDPAPSRNLDFLWTPSPDASSGEPIVAGEGHLVWRTRDRPSYDPRSFFSEYYGAMKDGRPDGRGWYKEINGVEYEGDWVGGLTHGQGHLKLPNGDEYQGTFVSGRPQGQGRYIDGSGEIYTGGFVAGLRQGRATTTLPNGAVYQSEWRNGVELPGSRSIRLAQARRSGSMIGAGAADADIRVVVRVNPVSPKMFAVDGESGDADTARLALGYAGANTDRGLVIRPNKKRLMDLWKGDAEIQLTPEEEKLLYGVAEASYGVFALGKTLLPPLDMTLEVTNRATSAVQISGAYLDLRRSMTDREPAIEISAGHRDQCDVPRRRTPYSPKLDFENFGWGPAQNAKLRFSFVNPAIGSTPSSYELTKSLPEIGKLLTVDFEPDLRANGVDVGLLARQAKTQGFKCDVGNLSQCVSKIGGRNVFGTLTDKISFPPGAKSFGEPNKSDLVAMLAGVLEYEWTDAVGKTHSRTSPFRSILWLGHIQTELECGEGATTELITQRPLRLQLDRTDYRIPVPFQREVPAGRVARYDLLIEAPRSSEHDFSIVLQLADGREIRSRPINLLYFLPSWYPKNSGS